VRQQAQVVQPDPLLDHVPGRAGYQRLEVRRPVQRTSDRDAAGAGDGHGRGARRPVLDENPRLDVLENPADPGLVQPVIDRGHDRAEQACGEQ
jgi:hypothetical protein